MSFEQIAHFRILGKIGQGGMGSVYKAEDTRLQRFVAIKFLAQDLAGDPKAAVRFLREARAIAALNHPHICTIYETGEHEGHPYFVMEYLDGQTLGAVAGGSPLAVATLSQLGSELAEALAAAHAKGILHRDLKPANVFIGTDGHVKLLDFGLARPLDMNLATDDTATLSPVEVASLLTEALPAASAEGPLTRAGTTLGTPGYMSPEQARGEELDARSDLFSLGVILYEMATGNRPFDAGSVNDTIDAILHRTPVPTVQRNPRIPSHLADTIDRLLQKDRKDRFTSAIEVREAWTRSAPAVPRRTPRHNLPATTTPFIGRERELAEVAELLQKSRLVTLTGFGGYGKTRLCVEVASRRLDSHPDGTWLVELSSLSDPGHVPSAIATALGVKDVPGTTTLDAVVRHLQHATALLLLDNCEHLIEACAHAANTVLRSCGGVKMLATSREPLGLTGESIWRIPSLPLPPQRERDTAESIRSFNAVQLFEARARAVHPPFVLTDANAHAVAQICRHLDGIPLAIELAAARVKVLTPEQIEEKLDQRFRLLTGGVRTAEERQRTLRGAVEWSHDLLHDEERRFFRWMSVFRGSRTLEAATAVAGLAVDGSEMDDFEVLDLLDRLVEKSFLTVDEPELQDAEPRYRMLETLEMYGRERLEEAGETLAAQARHTDYYLRLVERARNELTGPEAAPWTRRLSIEHENVLAALDACDSVENGAEKGLCIVTAAFRFWMLNGRFAEGVSLGQRALARPGTEDRTKQRADALYAVASLQRSLADLVRSKQTHEESLQIRREIGDSRGIAHSHFGLGSVQWGLADYDGAAAYYEAALAIYREAGDQGGIADCVEALGNVAWVRGEYPAAREGYETSLEIRRALGNRHGVAQSLNSLGNASWALGDFEGAKRSYRAGLEICQELGDRTGVGNALSNLGNVAIRQANFDEARTCFEASLDIRREVNDRAGMVNCFSGLGAVAWAHRDYVRARERYESALATVSEIGDRAGVALARYN
ncbi:MAG: tetratricopeptide repeat protein, partial [Candidatus Eisenbacteria bacterium]|nr:tetratricopeptide repeat protein [Candidatus Eisenbacteria bacterium]